MKNVSLEFYLDNKMTTNYKYLDTVAMKMCIKRWANHLADETKKITKTQIDTIPHSKKWIVSHRRHLFKFKVNGLSE